MERADIMPQITLYLDAETQELIERSARASGMSKSRWLTEIIHQHTGDDWPEGCLELAGRFPDFPLQEGLPKHTTPDAPRESF